MEFGDPRKLEFATWDIYSCLAQNLLHWDRYNWDADDKGILAIAITTNRNSDDALPERKVLNYGHQGID